MPQDLVTDYDPTDYPPFAVTVDLVVLTVAEQGLSVLAVRRGEPPFADRWALPGGFVKPRREPRDAAVRELAEETGLGLEVGGQDSQARRTTASTWSSSPATAPRTGTRGCGSCRSRTWRWRR